MPHTPGHVSVAHDQDLSDVPALQRDFEVRTCDLHINFCFYLLLCQFISQTA